MSAYCEQVCLHLHSLNYMITYTLTAHRRYVGEIENTPNTTLIKAQLKTAEADGESINARVKEVITKRCTTDIKGHKPAVGHPWRKMHIDKSATDSKTVIQ